MSSPNAKLLGDLARLAVKYRSRDWEEIAAWLDDDRKREQLRQLLLELAATSKQARAQRRKPSARGKRKPSRVAALRGTLADIRSADPARADLLEDVWLRLRQRELLPTLASVRAFAEAIGSKGVQQTRRDQAVTELMEHLVEIPPETLEQRMRETTMSDRSLGDEYERWVALILDRPRATRTTPPS